MGEKKIFAHKAAEETSNKTDLDKLVQKTGHTVMRNTTKILQKESHWMKRKLTEIE